MRRDYEYEELSRRIGFAPRQLEKVCRISDLLEDISHVPFLSDRLSLYGGTALAFIHLEDIRRLSVDLDFNYRHMDSRDWGKVRDDIDERIKRILYAQGYKEEDLAISASYPLGRMVVQYENHEGLNDSYMIEVGYMRRIPVLHKDIMGTFRHLGTGESIPIKTPEPDELYANKWCTLLYRRSSRDLFDVYMFSKKGFRQDTFRICALIDSLMRGQPKLYEIDMEEVVKSIPVDSALRNLLLTDISQYEFDEMREDVKEFSQEMIRQLTVDERSVIDRFYDDRKFNPEPIDPDGVLNMRIRDHPLIRWALKKL